MSARSVRWSIVAGGAAVVVAVVGGALLRPVTTATTDAGVAVECVGVADESACAAWGASVLEAGPGIRVFDPEDLERVRLGRSILGLFGECRAEYFLGRYEDSAAARETVPCAADQ